MTATIPTAPTAPTAPDLGELLAKHPELNMEQDDYNINVTANYGERLEAPDVEKLYSRHSGGGLPAHLYFHIPLCDYICKFCNYVKRKAPRDPGAKEATLREWTEALVLESETRLQAAPWIREAIVESAYLGGGTATLLGPEFLDALLSHVRANYRLSDDAEVTLEGNPDNFSPDYLDAALNCGFNRFSVGVQSLSDVVTQFTGRDHDRETSLAAVDALADTGCPFNVDYMYGLPFQTVDQVASDVATLVEHGAPTITLYRLRNVDRQSMGIGNRAEWNVPSIRDSLHQARVFPTLRTTYSMRSAAVQVLKDHSYRPSPCGWWSAADTYPNGNIPQVSRNKWQNFDSMIAYGPGAYGWLTGDNHHVLQTHNEIDIASYRKRQRAGDFRPLAFGRLLEGQQAIAAALAFAFKANQPFGGAPFKQRWQTDLAKDQPYADILRSLIDRDLLQCLPDGTFMPTANGEALHEEIISVYIHGAIGTGDFALCKR
jgi:coproporphyrinogen III oxidase-like Fe-S oxidoreductase